MLKPEIRNDSHSRSYTPHSERQAWLRKGGHFNHALYDRAAGGIEALVALLEGSQNVEVSGAAATALASLAKGNPDNKATIRAGKGVQVVPFPLALTGLPAPGYPC